MFETTVVPFWNLVLEPFLIPLVVSCIFSFLGCCIMIKINIADHPIGRSAHFVPTPKSGGVAILAAFLLPLFLLPHPGPVFSDTLWLWNLVLFSSFFMGLMGLWDDIRPMGAPTRLVLQIGVGILVGFSGLCFPAIPLWTVDIPLFWPLAWIGATVFWLCLVTNTVNFMDGINNITVVTTFIALISLSILLFLNNQDHLAGLPLLLGGALLGFWPHNARGRLFMGDVGSQFLGFFLGAFMIFAHLNEGGHIPFVCMPMVFFLYFFDEIITRLRRLFKGHQAMTAHREHLYQLLERTDVSHGAVAALYGFIFLLQGMTAILLFFYDGFAVYAYGAHFLLNSFLATWIFRRARRAYLIV